MTQPSPTVFPKHSAGVTIRSHNSSLLGSCCKEAAGGLPKSPGEGGSSDGVTGTESAGEREGAPAARGSSNHPVNAQRLQPGSFLPSLAFLSVCNNARSAPTKFARTFTAGLCWQLSGGHSGASQSPPVSAWAGLLECWAGMSLAGAN